MLFRSSVRANIARIMTIMGLGNTIFTVFALSRRFQRRHDSLHGRFMEDLVEGVKKDD